MAFGNSTEWDRVAGKATGFVSYKDKNKTIMWWICLFTGLSSICFFYSSYLSWSTIWNRFQLSRYGLYLACVMAIFFGFMMIFWGSRAEAYADYPNVTPVVFDKYFVTC